jgi:hypothetical protein
LKNLTPARKTRQNITHFWGNPIAQQLYLRHRKECDEVHPAHEFQSAPSTVGETISWISQSRLVANHRNCSPDVRKL